MEIKDIKAGETYNMRVKVIYVDSDAKCTEIGTIPVDKNGKELEREWAYYGSCTASALSPITPENGTKNTESAPKYDPCRLFRKGDKVRMVKWHGRSFFDGGCHPNCNKWTVTEDETSGVNLEQNGHTITDVPACFIELVTPVEELEPFYVCENTESKSFEVRRKEDHKVQAAFYYFNEDDAPAKSAAAKATLEHCDRLNAEHRKEQK